VLAHFTIGIAAMAVFIFVHGTFVAEANWPLLQDGLSEAVRLADDRASFEQVVWTGKNRMTARQVASNTIAEKVRTIQLERNKEKIFVVGHSHGGSAVAYFVKNYPEDAKLVSGYAFLSTPFVAIHPRTNAKKALATSAFFLGLSFINWWSDYNAPTTWRHRGNFYSWTWWTGNLLAMTIWVIMLARLYKYPEEEIKRRALADQTADLPDGNYLFVRCSGDEAAAAMSAAQFANWLGLAASRILQHVLKPLFSKNPAIPIVFFVFLTLVHTAAATISPDLLLEPSATIDVIRNHPLLSFVLLAIFAIWLFFLFGFLAGLLLLLSQALVSKAFGWTDFVTSFLVDLAIEPIPFGSRKLIHIEWSPASSSAEALTHSWTYSHPAAIEHIKRAGLSRP
jgi:pimeloyl-ACP methyl ester carboxylesterase